MSIVYKESTNTNNNRFFVSDDFTVPMVSSQGKYAVHYNPPYNLIGFNSTIHEGQVLVKNSTSDRKVGKDEVIIFSSERQLSENNINDLSWGMPIEKVSISIVKPQEDESGNKFVSLKAGLYNYILTSSYSLADNDGDTTKYSSKYEFYDLYNTVCYGFLMDELDFTVIFDGPEVELFSSDGTLKSEYEDDIRCDLYSRDRGNPIPDCSLQIKEDIDGVYVDLPDNILEYEYIHLYGFEDGAITLNGKTMKCSEQPIEINSLLNSGYFLTPGSKMYLSRYWSPK